MIYFDFEVTTKFNRGSTQIIKNYILGNLKWIRWIETGIFKIWNVLLRYNYDIYNNRMYKKYLIFNIKKIHQIKQRLNSSRFFLNMFMLVFEIRCYKKMNRCKLIFSIPTLRSQHKKIRMTTSIKGKLWNKTI